MLVKWASTEALSLAHRWPLLADGQDPESLEARVAYHLRRLGIRWRDVRATALMPRDEIAELVQGRLSLSQALVLELATRLHLPLSELSRPLLHLEAEAWAFYRSSARDRLHVWQRAQASWERAGLSLRLASAVMGLKPSQVTHALMDPERRLVMSHEAASRLASAVGIEAGAPFFIANVERALPPDHGVEVVQPLSAAAISELYRNVGAKRSAHKLTRSDER